MMINSQRTVFLVIYDIFDIQFFIDKTKELNAGSCANFCIQITGILYAFLGNMALFIGYRFHIAFSTHSTVYISVQNGHIGNAEFCLQTHFAGCFKC